MAADTATRILDAALDQFRQRGFEAVTMREIAAKAGVATGAAYYYYPSKDAIVMGFYQRSCDDMQSQIEDALAPARGLEARLSALIQVKLDYFGPNRSVLRALLRNGADPQHPLSPFAGATKPIRDVDIEWFRRILVDCGARIPPDIQADLPGALWFFQMGVILFWIVDESANQIRTAQLLPLAAKSVVTLIRAASLPLMRPMRKNVIQLVGLVKELGQ